MDNGNFKDEMRLYRGINCDLTFDVIKSYPIMQHIVFHAFTSTSSIKDVVYSFKKSSSYCFILFNIKYKTYPNRKNYRPKGIAKISSFQSENEYLLSPFSKFVVKQIDVIDSKTEFEIHLENLD